jgi:hypothetical protein
MPDTRHSNGNSKLNLNDERSAGKPITHLITAQVRTVPSQHPNKAFTLVIKK